MGNATLDKGLDILFVLGSDGYATECANRGTSRLFDVPDHEVLKLHKQVCEITKERGTALCALISAWNYNNLSSQIKGGYNLKHVAFTINDAHYSKYEFAQVCYHLRRLGVKLPFVLNDIGKPPEKA